MKSAFRLLPVLSLALGTGFPALAPAASAVSAPAAPAAAAAAPTPDEIALSEQMSALGLDSQAVSRELESKLGDIRKLLNRVVKELRQVNPPPSGLELTDISARITDIRRQTADIISQIQSYDSLLNSFLQVLGDQPVPGEDPAIAGRRKKLQKNEQNIRSMLVYAKLYDLRAKQLSTLVGSVQTAIQQQTLARKSHSPLTPAFWAALSAERPVDLDSLKTAGGPVHTGLLLGGAGLALLLTIVISQALNQILPRLFRRWTAVNAEAALAALSRPSLIQSLFSGKPGKGRQDAAALKPLPDKALKASPLGAPGHLLGGLVCSGLVFLLWEGWVLLAQDYGTRVAVIISRTLPACGFILGAGIPLTHWIRGGPRYGLSFVMAASLLLTTLMSAFQEQKFIGPSLDAFLQGSLALISVSCLVWIFHQVLSVAKTPKNEEGAAEKPDGKTAAPGDSPIRGLHRPLQALTGLLFLITLATVLAGYMAFAFAMNVTVLIVIYAFAVTCLLIGAWQRLSALILSSGRLGGRKLIELGISPRRLEQFNVLITAAGCLILCAVLLAILENGSDVSFMALHTRLAGIFSGSLFEGIPISPKTLVTCLLILFCTHYGIRLAALWLTSRFFPTTALGTGARTSIVTIFSYTTWILASLVCLTVLGVSISSLTWIVSALSVGVGFGLQSIVKDFVSGIMLLAERPIQPGDIIDIGGSQGEVQKIAMRATNINLGSGTTLIVPNSQFIASVVKNASYAARPNRLALDFVLPSAADLNRVRDLILNAVQEQSDILAYPAPSIVMTALAGDQVNFTLRAFYPEAGSGTGVRSRLLNVLFEKFHREGMNLTISGS